MKLIDPTFNIAEWVEWILGDTYHENISVLVLNLAIDSKLFIAASVPNFEAYLLLLVSYTTFVYVQNRVLISIVKRFA